MWSWWKNKIKKLPTDKADRQDVKEIPWVLPDIRDRMSKEIIIRAVMM
jgi:hypothetical protein